MAHVSDLISTDIQAYLRTHEHKSLLRFITCGSVDDGKSTLIGRLLYDSKMIFEDQLAALETDSKKVGTQGENIDFALLVDGLAAEREQGITIDVAYRFFSTEKRKFIVADTPGHEQYTRNMVTGASTASLAILLIDARKGVLTQTRRHSFLVSLIGIRDIVLAINKMDLVNFSKDIFNTILAEYRAFAQQLGLEKIVAIPMSALQGDNITEPSANTPWYGGPTLMQHLETVSIDDALQDAPFRMPVQWVNRPHQDFRGFSGLVVSGTVRKGDRLRVLPGGKESTVARLVTYDGDLDSACAEQSITVVLADEIDASRGNVLAPADALPGVASQFEVTIVWMTEAPLQTGKLYWVKCGAKQVSATVTDVEYKVNVNTLEQQPTKELHLNEIGTCHISFDQPIAFEPYAQNKDLGGFVLIDRMTNVTVGAGLIRGALKRTFGADWRQMAVTPQKRAALKNQQACVLWFTGTREPQLAELLERRLHALGHHTILLTDGDSARLAELAARMVDAGLLALVSHFSPTQAERRHARRQVAEQEFIEIFVDEGAPGHQRPDNAEVVINPAILSHEDAVEVIVQHLADAKITKLGSDWNI